MEKRIKEYFETLKDLFDRVIATDANGKECAIDKAITRSIQIITDRAASGRKILFIGNGASASLASHMATDFWKNAGIRALAFNDSALLTSVGNDYGYERVFEKPLEMFAKRGDVLFAISASGASENIIRGARQARSKGLFIVTLSGFDNNNPLRSMGDLNFYVPFSSYGPVEVVHHSICHCVVDSVISQRDSSRVKQGLLK